jgi:predicted RNase H-like HicB family nuclease
MRDRSDDGPLHDLARPDLEEGGFTVTVPALPGCVTEGNTFEEAIENAREAIRGYAASLRKHGEELPEEDTLPVLVTIEVEVDEAALSR